MAFYEIDNEKIIITIRVHRLQKIHTHTHPHTHTHIYIYMYTHTHTHVMAFYEIDIEKIIITIRVHRLQKIHTHTLTHTHTYIYIGASIKNFVKQNSHVSPPKLPWPLSYFHLKHNSLAATFNHHF
jgi:hypothetical protein